MADNLKHCSKCGTGYPPDHYYTVTNKKTGSVYTYHYCRKCHYKKTKPIREQWAIDNPERLHKLQYKATRKHLDQQVAGVYMIQTSKGVYIGESDHVKFRISQHRSENQYGSMAGRKAKILQWHIIEEINDKKERLKREKYYIKLLQPVLNVHGR